MIVIIDFKNRILRPVGIKIVLKDLNIPDTEPIAMNKVFYNKEKLKEALEKGMIKRIIGMDGQKYYDINNVDNFLDFLKDNENKYENSFEYVKDFSK